LRVMAKTSDDVLWRRTCRGDRDAFAELFDRHARRVFGFCLRQTGNWALAEDLTSVAFLEAWRRRSALVEEGKVPAWLLGIANNVVRHQRRSLRRYRRALDRLPSPRAQPDHADDSVARASAEQQAAELLGQLRQLPKPEQAVVALVGWEGLSCAEASVALGVPEATVRSRLYRARRRLQTRTEPDTQPPGPQPPVSIDEGIGI
jgi:RNA polymerase sigma factor (sigma-70 family)